MSGVILTSVAVTGPGRERAAIELTDGLNVIAGASDTGKSYLLSLIDYAFGATNAPRAIPAATGYTSVTIHFEERDGQVEHRVTRAFGANRVTYETVGPGEASRQDIPARHATPGHDSLSRRLLEVSGFSPATLIRRNAHGATRRLSFRDIAYLCFVDEARIIDERPPFRSENYVEHTSRAEVLKLVATGAPSTQADVPTPTARRMDDSVRRDLLTTLIAKIETELGDGVRDETQLGERLSTLEQSLQEALTEYESTTVAAQETEQRIAAQLTELREVGARIVISEGLFRRFGLLAEHYQSDIARLEAISEVADVLTLLPFDTCPICGSSAEHHRPELVHEGLTIEGVRAASDAELEKTRRLLRDLDPVLTNVGEQLTGDRDTARELGTTIDADERRLATDLSPQVRATKEAIEQVATERAELVRRQAQLEQLADLRDRLALTRESVVTDPDPGPAAEALSQALRPFTDEVRLLLNSWRMPGAGEVYFSEASMDLVIGGEPRASHGKGVRALTCAAFILGLARNAGGLGLPHLGIVALDSPLVAYREPDSQDRGTAALIAADVKGSFYRSLASGLARVQVIVFENESPPDDLAPAINYIHFSKASFGRYGFLPVS